jgi:hypothetical protein
MTIRAVSWGHGMEKGIAVQTIGNVPLLSEPRAEVANLDDDDN